MDNITKQNGNEVGRHQVEGQTIIINQQERRSTNGLGTAGFILALLGLIFSWVPGLGWGLWALGLIFSFVGYQKQEVRLKKDNKPLNIVMKNDMAEIDEPNTFTNV